MPAAHAEETAFESRLRSRVDYTPFSRRSPWVTR